MKLLQLNMHRGEGAHALLSQIILEQEADVAIISEQYRQKESGMWFDDDTKTAAIWVPDNRRLQLKNTGKGNGFVWVQTEEITLVSCYLTPSDRIGVFENKLDGIEDTIRNLEGDFLVAGDFNSRAVDWGMQTTDPRGRRIVQMMARTGLTVANVGSIPTFRRHGCEGTIPDVTMVSERIARRIHDWRVLEIFTASDHQYISYTFRTNSVVQPRTTGRGTRRWNVNRLDTSVLLAEIDNQVEVMDFGGDAINTVQEVMNALRMGCSKAMPRVRGRAGPKTAVYWWNDTIDGLRRNCIRQRRKYTRAMRRGMAEAERAGYKEAKRLLGRAIKESKRRQFEDLREDLNRDPWGLGYKIVMKKLGIRTPVQEMDEGTMEHIVRTLFPTHDLGEERNDAEESVAVPLFTRDELRIAARSLKDRRAPGPDGIPAEVLKKIAVIRPELLLSMYNSCLEDGIFPEPWKRQKLVLISKGKGNPNSPSSYRPLCMLDTAGKLLERLLKPRLEEAIHNGGGLSSRQYGFRPGRSTVHAVKEIADVFKAAQLGNHHSRPVVLLATLDVKNAFNSLRWSDMLRALAEDFAVPSYLMRLLRSYLRNRVLIYDTNSGQKRMNVTSGAAQGSVLGPVLWNVSYDGILNLEMPENTFLIGYADDIAAVITARNIEDAQRRLRQVMIRTRTWLDSHGLELATHKTELLLLTKRPIPVGIEMSIDEVLLTTKSCVKYLGIRLDPKLKYSQQLQYAKGKAAKITAQLSRLMANVGGPLPCKRKLLMEACNSVLLYGCEIWAETLRTKERASTLLSVQRTAALRVTSAYRTVSASAVFVIAGMIPLDLQAEERMTAFATGQTTQSQRDLRSQTIEKWQARCNEERYGRWTARLIPDIRKWIDRGHGEVGYYITQMLSGHGYFRKYLHTMGKCSTPFCIYEGTDVEDDVEHTFFSCQNWTPYRQRLEAQIGVITPYNLVDKMTDDEATWRAVAEFCENLLRAKKRDLDRAGDTPETRRSQHSDS